MHDSDSDVSFCFVIRYFLIISAIGNSVTVICLLYNKRTTKVSTDTQTDESTPQIVVVHPDLDMSLTE